MHHQLENFLVQRIIPGWQLCTNNTIYICWGGHKAFNPYQHVTVGCSLFLKFYDSNMSIALSNYPALSNKVNQLLVFISYTCQIRSGLSYGDSPGWSKSITSWHFTSIVIVMKKVGLPFTRTIAIDFCISWHTTGHFQYRMLGESSLFHFFQHRLRLFDLIIGCTFPHELYFDVF